MVKTMEETIATKKCIACFSDILHEARVCRECGSRQNRLTTSLFKISTVSAAIITVLSLITTAVALWPVAYRQIIRDPQARLIQVTFDHPSPEMRTLGSFALFNGGNVDAYVTRVELHALGDNLKDIGSTNFRLYELLKQGEGFERDIGYQGALFRRRADLTAVFLDQKTLPIAKNALVEANLPIRKCIGLFPFNARLGLNAPADGSYRNANASAVVSGTVFFLDRSNPDIEHSSEIKNLYIEAAITLAPRCISQLGGNEKVRQILQNN